MFKSATLVPTHPTSPWRGHRQLSLSSVSRVKVEGKQLRLASPPSVSLFGSCSPPTPPPLLQVLPVSRSLFEAAAWPRSPLLPPQTHSSCGSSRPLLHAGLIRRAAPAGLPLDMQMTVAESLPARLVVYSHSRAVCRSAFLQMKVEPRGFIDDIIPVRQTPLYGFQTITFIGPL